VNKQLNQFMKPSIFRRNRRFTMHKPAVQKQNNKQKQQFFANAVGETFFQPAPVLQRKCENCEEEEKKINRVADKKEEEKLQKKGEIDSSNTNVTSSYIHSINGKGAALPKADQQFFSARMGYDFSSVRVHTGNEAAASAKEVHAKAYTVGNNIVFNESEYNTTSTEGKQLLAHELTHTVQQTGGIQRQPMQGMPSRDWNIPITEDDISDPQQKEEYREYLRMEQAKKLWANALERFAKGELDDRDIKNARLMNRLTGLKESEVSVLITKIKAHQTQRAKDVADPAVTDPVKKTMITTDKMIEWLEVRKTISTPMPEGATVQTLLPGMIDSYSVTFGDVVIKIMPDTHGASGNETAPSSNFQGQFTWVVVGGKITDLKKDGAAYNPTQLEISIQTKYKDSPDGQSGYGKGTTEGDKAEGTTTLRVHEGQHGTDFIDYLKNTAMPVSLKAGINGNLTPAQFTKLLNYINDITKATCETTDQSGFSQDEFLQTPHGKASGIVSCRP
jgi:hypothetical protein